MPLELGWWLGLPLFWEATKWDWTNNKTKIDRISIRKNCDQCSRSMRRIPLKRDESKFHCFAASNGWPTLDQNMLFGCTGGPPSNNGNAYDAYKNKHLLSFSIGNLPRFWPWHVLLSCDLPVWLQRGLSEFLYSPNVWWIDLFVISSFVAVIPRPLLVIHPCDHLGQGCIHHQHAQKNGRLTQTHMAGELTFVKMMSRKIL